MTSVATPPQIGGFAAHFTKKWSEMAGRVRRSNRANSLRPMRQFPIRVAGIVLAPLFFGLIVAAQTFSEAIGTVGVPLATGIVLAIAVYSLSIFERRWNIARVGSRNGE